MSLHNAYCTSKLSKLYDCAKTTQADRERRRTKVMFTRWYVWIEKKKTCRIRWMFLFVRLLLQFSMAQLWKRRRKETRKKRRKNVLKKCVHVLICETASVYLCVCDFVSNNLHIFYWDLSISMCFFSPASSSFSKWCCTVSQTFIVAMYQPDIGVQ